MNARPHISSIRVSGERAILPPRGSVTALVGPNNTGKSHFLRQLREHLKGVSAEDVRRGLITEVNINWDIRPQDLVGFLIATAKRNFEPAGQGYYSTGVDGARLSTFSELDADSYSIRSSSFRHFVDVFVSFDEPISRIQVSEPAALAPSLSQTDPSPVKLSKRKSTFDKVAGDFMAIFDETLSVRDLRDGFIGFSIGQSKFRGPSSNDAFSDSDLENMRSLPALADQGLGMRSVFGLLTRLHLNNSPIVLIDEPEAFLHPPQAQQLGQIVSRIATENSVQVFCATHDRNFLAGLVSDPRAHVQVERLARTTVGGDPIFSSLAISPSFLDDVRSESRVRYTTVLDGLFSPITVVVEDETDALFYSEAFSSYLATKEARDMRIRPTDIHFLPTGGQAAFPSTLKLLRQLASPAIVIGDADLLANVSLCKKTFRILDIPEIQEIEDDLERFQCLVHRHFASEINALDKSKQDGKLRKLMVKHSTVNSDVVTFREIVGTLISKLAKYGLFLVPFGELEDFDSQLLAEVGKAEWIRAALTEKLHEKENVTEFIGNVVNSSLVRGNAFATELRRKE